MALLLINTRDPEPRPERLRPDWGLGIRLLLLLGVAIAMSEAPGVAAVLLGVLGLIAALRIGRYALRPTRP